MSWPGKEVSSAVFKLAASLADSAVFLQIGLNIILVQENGGSGGTSAEFFAITFVACLVGRAANVFPLSFVLNRFRPAGDQIQLRTQGQMWHAGLRGAIAFASALSFPSQNRDAIVWATASVCLATIFIMGPTTTPSLRLLGIEFGDAVAAKRALRERAEIEARGRRLREERAARASGEPPPARGSLLERIDAVLQRAVFGAAAYEKLQLAGGFDIHEKADELARIARSASSSSAQLQAAGALIVREPSAAPLISATARPPPSAAAQRSSTAPAALAASSFMTRRPAASAPGDVAVRVLTPVAEEGEAAAASQERSPNTVTSHGASESDQAFSESSNLAST